MDIKTKKATPFDLSDSAIAKISLLKESEENKFFRVYVTGGGCSGFQYGLNIEDSPESDDEVLDISGVKVFVDPFSAQYLDGVEIDYVSSMMGQGFTFRNPNASGGCGCGSSFTV